jgi:23S rRNA (cytidine1920-2'-O)/16S rRNA (cytidine1409-2'-O)-methyltransferase
MSTTVTRQRLDQALVARGLVKTRSRARDLVLRGLVLVGEAPARRPAQIVGAEDRVALADGAGDYVSRGALKLGHALGHFDFDATGRIGLDIGASTGGFTETLLAAGAVKVYAVDNGHGQLHPRLLADARVVSREGQDARELSRLIIPEPVTALASDVSFISLTKVLPAALPLAAPGCWLVALIKPQFEAAPGDVPKSGVVKDPVVHCRAVTRVRQWLGAQPGWRIRGITSSPILGGSGNTEFLIGASLDG